MAKKQTSAVNAPLNSKTAKRPGVHSKKKASVSKRAKNYLKRYRGQGR